MAKYGDPYTEFTFTFMHLADAFIQSDLQLHSGYTFSLVHVFPGNRTHNLLRYWRNALPLSHTICALILTYPKCTHTLVNTHPEQWAAIYAAAPREQLGVRCLAQGHLSHDIKGGESAVHSLHPTYNSCRPETRTRNLWVTSPTL